MNEQQGALLALIAISVIVLAGIAISTLTGTGIAGFVVMEDQPIIDQAVKDTLAQEESVRVIITKKETPKKALIRAAGAEDLTGALREHDITPTMIDERLNMAVATITKEELAALSKNRHLESIREDEPTTTYLSVSTLHVKSAHTNNHAIAGTRINGTGETVCVIDTGIDYRHPSLGGCTEESFAAGNCTKTMGGTNIIYAETDDPMDDNGHGTHVAGIIAGQGSITGVAPGARLVAVKVLDYDGAGFVSDLVVGIQWCTDHQETYNISVISISAGGINTYSSACDATFPQGALAVASANAKNLSVVVATGNDGRYTGVNFPACLNKTIAVTSVSGNTSYAASANRGSGHDHLVAAPGVGISSANLVSGTTTKSGTSMATPHVSGVIALLKQAHTLLHGKELTDEQAKQAIQATGTPLHDSQTSKEYPYLQSLQAVMLLDNTTPEATLTVNQTLIRKEKGADEHNESLLVTWSTASNHDYDVNLSIIGPEGTVLEMTNTTGNLTLTAQHLALGAHNITLRANNTHGTTSITRTFTVKNEPMIIILIDGEEKNMSYPGAHNISVDITKGDIVMITLTMGNDTLAAEEWEAVMLEEGAHTITAHHEENDEYLGVNETITLTIIDPLPVITNTTPEQEELAVMENETIAFSVEAYDPLGGALNTTWQEGMIIMKNETYLFNATNKKNATVTLTVTNDEGNDTKTWTITVNPVPLVVTNKTPEEEAVVLEHNDTMTFTFTAEDYLSRTVNYTWLLDDENISEENTITLNASEHGPGTLLLLARATNNRTITSATWNVTIMPEPHITFTQNVTSKTFTRGQSASIDLTEHFTYYVQGASVEYALTNNDLTSTTSGHTLTITASNAGEYTTAIVASSDNLTNQTNNFTVIVNDPPAPPRSTGGGGGFIISPPPPKTNETEPADETTLLNETATGNQTGMSEGAAEQETDAEATRIDEAPVAEQAPMRTSEPRVSTAATETERAEVFVARVDVEREPEARTAVNSFKGKTYAVYAITTQETNEAAREQAEQPPAQTITFEVEREWLEEQRILPGMVAMYRYADDEWEELPTTIVEEQEDKVLYESTTTGFSYFLIGTRSEEPVTESPANSIEEQADEERMTSEERKGRAAALVIIVFSLLVFMLLGNEQKKRRKKNR